MRSRRWPTRGSLREMLPLILSCDIDTERHKMADQRSRAVALCLVIAWVVVIGTAENNAPKRGE